jgi:tetratricopeptide (TPR) repeat protein
MLSGETPYTGRTPQAILAKKLTEPLPRITAVRETVPASVEAALTKALSKSGVDRFRTVAEFTAALGAPAREPPLSRRSRRMIMWTVAAAAVAAFVGWRSSRGPGDAELPSPDRPYAVLAAVSGTADSATRDVIAFAFRTAVDASHLIQTVPDGEVERLLTLMDRPASTPLDQRTAYEIAERIGVATVILPRLDRLGDAFVFTVRMEDVGTERLRAEASGRVASEDSVIDLVYEAAQRLRRRLGESRQVVARTEPLPMVMTGSLDALRLYREAYDVRMTAGCAQAVPMFREILAIDPDFAEARATLAKCYANIGLRDSMLAGLRRALETPERLGDLRRRDVEALWRLSTDFAALDERLFLTGYTVNDANRLSWFRNYDSAFHVATREVREEARRYRRFDPEQTMRTVGVNWPNAIGFGIASGRLGELAVLRDSLRVDPTPYWDVLEAIDAADWARADSLRLAGHVQSPRQIAELDAAHGRIRASHSRLSRIERADHLKAPLILEVVYGMTGTDTEQSLTDRGLDAVLRYAVHGVRSTLRGDTSEAKRVAARLRASRDSATSDLFEQAFEPMLALLDAAVARRRGDWRTVATMLGPSAQRLHGQGYGYVGDPDLLWWVLAEAYEQLGQPDSAIYQLRSVLNGRDDYLWHVLSFSAAHFKLGQLYAQKGDREQALQHYTTFLDAFTDPDPEYVWMVTEARAEVERLGRGR